MSLKLVHPSLRAAFRERLLTVADVDASVSSITASNGVYSRTTGSWITGGFRIGQEVTVSGLSGANGTVRVRSLTALDLTTTGTASGSGTGRFLVGLPQGRAWEGQGVYRPTLGQPYISEAYVPASSARLSQGSTTPVIQHDINANVTLFYPSSEGTEAIERMAGAIQAHFMPKATKLVRDNVGARVVDTRRSPVMLDGDWLSIGVTIQLLAFTQG